MTDRLGKLSGSQTCLESGEECSHLTRIAAMTDAICLKAMRQPVQVCLRDCRPITTPTSLVAGGSCGCEGGPPRQLSHVQRKRPAALPLGMPYTAPEAVRCTLCYDNGSGQNQNKHLSLSTILGDRSGLASCPPAYPARMRRTIAQEGQRMISCVHDITFAWGPGWCPGPTDSRLSISSKPILARYLSSKSAHTVAERRRSRSLILLYVPSPYRPPHRRKSTCSGESKIPHPMDFVDCDGWVSKTAGGLRCWS
jgi:hypothetical protein